MKFQITAIFVRRRLNANVYEANQGEKLNWAFEDF